MDHAIKILGREVVSRAFGLLEKINIRRRRFDGHVQELNSEFYNPGDAAAILLYDPSRGCVLLVRQFRLAGYLAEHREAMIEVCAGKLEGESAAIRIVAEAMEETGVSIKSPRHLFDVFMSPGVYGERISCFASRYSPADRIDRGGGLADEGEDIEILEPTLEEALAMIARGEISDAKTIILLQYAALSGVMHEDERKASS